MGRICSTRLVIPFRQERSHLPIEPDGYWEWGALLSAILNRVRQKLVLHLSWINQCTLAYPNLSWCFIFGRVTGWQGSSVGGAKLNSLAGSWAGVKEGERSFHFAPIGNPDNSSTLATGSSEMGIFYITQSWSICTRSAFLPFGLSPCFQLPSWVCQLSLRPSVLGSDTTLALHSHLLVEYQY